MGPETQLQDISRTIQLAVAPVFLLMAIGSTLSVLATRLGRAIDRARILEIELQSLDGPPRAIRVRELEQLARRVRLISWALTSGVAAAVLVCLLIGVAFLGYLFAANIAATVAVLFVLAVTVFMVALLLFLREASIAIALMRFSLPPEVKKGAP